VEAVVRNGSLLRLGRAAVLGVTVVVAPTLSDVLGIEASANAQDLTGVMSLDADELNERMATTESKSFEATAGPCLSYRCLSGAVDSVRDAVLEEIRRRAILEALYKLLTSCAFTEAFFADTPVTQMSVSSAERAVFCLTNDERAKQGIPALRWDAKLAAAARGHAQDAVNQKWWTDNADPHTNPQTGSTPQDRILAAGYCSGGYLTYSGENAYWGADSFAAPTPRQAVNWWMTHEPPETNGHRKNILSTTYEDLGVGVVMGAPREGDYPNAVVFVQDFGTCSSHS
jgi:uncharacterized protein YkwD